jgi:hypothetical protein
MGQGASCVTIPLVFDMRLETSLPDLVYRDLDPLDNGQQAKVGKDLDDLPEEDLENTSYSRYGQVIRDVPLSNGLNIRSVVPETLSLSLLEWGHEIQSVLMDGRFGRLIPHFQEHVVVQNPRAAVDILEPRMIYYAPSMSTRRWYCETLAKRGVACDKSDELVNRQVLDLFDPYVAHKCVRVKFEIEDGTTRQETACALIHEAWLDACKARQDNDQQRISTCCSVMQALIQVLRSPATSWSDYRKLICMDHPD